MSSPGVEAGWLTAVRALPLAVMLAACHSPSAAIDAGLPDGACEAVTGPATLQIGGGSAVAGFIALEDGDEMQLYAGGAYPYHLRPSIRAHGVYPGEQGRFGHPFDPEIYLEALSQGAVIGNSLPERVGLTVTDEGMDAEFYVAFLDTISPDEYRDQPVTLRGQINDFCGNSATGELSVIPCSLCN